MSLKTKASILESVQSDIICKFWMKRVTPKGWDIPEDKSLTLLPSRRVQTRNTHGTGCTLSSAFAAALARGEELTVAARSAKRYIEQAVISGAEYEIGHGHGPVDHFFAFRQK